MRREFLGAGLGLGAAGLLGGTPARAATPHPPDSSGPRYKVAACDWMLLKRQKLGAFALSKDCGLDGVEVDLGGLGTRPAFDNKSLR